MPLIRNLNKSLLIRVLALTLLVGMSCVGVVSATPQRWPKDWSAPIHVGTGVRAHGHRTAPNDLNSMWIAMVSQDDDGISIDIRLLDIYSGNVVVKTSLPVSNSLKGYALTSDTSGAIVTWLEREEGVRSTLWVANITHQETVSRRRVWQSPNPAENPDIVVDDQGVVHIVFTAAEEGLQSVHIISAVDLHKDTEYLAHRLSTPKQLARLPIIVIDQGYLHLIYYTETMAESYAVYQLRELQGLELLTMTGLGVVPDRYEYPPTMLADHGTSVCIVWQRMMSVPGKVVVGATVKGTLSSGQWSKPYTAVFPGQGGSVALARACQGSGGRVLTTWLTESGFTWQAFAVISDREGLATKAGYATMAQGNVFDARPLFVGETGVVSFANITLEGLAEYYYVNTESPRKVPFALLIGVDPHAPLQDIVYKYFTLLTAAAVMAFSAIGAFVVSMTVVLGLTRLRVFSSSALGQLLRIGTLLLVLVVLKQPNSLLYYKAQLIPGWGAVVSWVGAAIFTFSVIHAAKLEIDDSLTLGAAGVLFLLCDTFTAIYILGVDVW